jgi:hypothetical protein
MSDYVAMVASTQSILVSPSGPHGDRGGGAAAWGGVEIDLVVKA